MQHHIDRRFCVAPMLDWTDKHCRYWLRLFFPGALLYTEMITVPALLYGDTKRLLDFDEFEQPLALQLGGSDPEGMADCAKIAHKHGYNEVNINVGCPSDRVQSGAFGACLMAEPHIVAACVSAMKAAVDIPVTVKTRIGIDKADDYSTLKHFISCIVDAGCQTVIIHARKAWLQGLSPKENREIPPLRYEEVYRVKQDFPDVEIIINGGIQRIDEVIEHLKFVDGTMIGREAYQNPYALIEIRNVLHGYSAPIPSRFEIIERYIPYIQKQLDNGIYLKHMTRHMLGLFQGVPGAKQWRRYLSEQAVKPGADINIVIEAMNKVKALQSKIAGVAVNES